VKITDDGNGVEAFDESTATVDGSDNLLTAYTGSEATVSGNGNDGTAFNETVEITGDDQTYL
jgi:hypothetical protein